MLRVCLSLSARAVPRSAARATTVQSMRSARAAAAFSTQATPPAPAAAVPPAASASSATPAPPSASPSSPVLTATPAELARLAASPPTPEQLAAFARDKERAAASKAEWDKWHQQQKKFGPPISEKEILAVKILAGLTALWVGYRAYLYSQIQEPVRPKHWPAEDDEDAIPAYPGAPTGGAARPSPKGFDIPPLSYEAHTLPQIFLSLAEPLAQFDTVAEEFVARKSAAEDRMADLNARRKLGAVDSKVLAAAETELRKIRTEERLVMQPRLAYLRDLYKQRSLELMQRGQYNAERVVEAATKRATEPSAAALKLEVEAELAGFQQQIQHFSSLPQIVEKYGFQQSLSAQRIMQPNSTAA